jgi:hypothetical protein
MEQERHLNPKKRMLREWTMAGTVAMDQVKILLFVQHCFLGALSISEV